VDFQKHPSRTELSRPLVAADAGIDPHRLVTLCCEHAGANPLSVSLVISVEDESRPWSESTAAAERVCTTPTCSWAQRESNSKRW
jgi:hypothetical protein